MKRISLFTLIAAVLVSSVSLAAPVKIVGAQADAVKKALMIYDFECSRINASEVKERISLAQIVMLDTSGTQPAIIFYRDLKPIVGDPIKREVISVKTTEDYKKVLHIRYEFQQWQESNTGTLVNPEIIKTFVTTSNHFC